MLRKTCLAALAALMLTGCGGAPALPLVAPDRSYKLRDDLCEVLDYKAFSRWFGTMEAYPNHGLATDAKVVCEHHTDDSTASTRVQTRVEAYKSNMDGKLKAKVDDARYGKGPRSYEIIALDRDLFLKVFVWPTAADDSSFRDEMPRVTIDFIDQVLERLREKS